MRKYIKIFPIILLFSIPIVFSGCVNTGTGGSGGFDLVKFLQNPIVMIIIVLVIVWYLSNRRRG